MDTSPEPEPRQEAMQVDHAICFEDEFQLAYEHLHRLANKLMRGRQTGLTIQPTALVHEAYLRLAASSSNPTDWQSRAHLIAVASKAMRQLLSNHIRNRSASKRGGGWNRVTLSGVDGSQGDSHVDLLTLQEALDELGQLDERKEKIVSLRLLGGMTIEEIALLTDCSQATVERDWRVARAWLSSRLR